MYIPSGYTIRHISNYDRGSSNLKRGNVKQIGERGEKREKGVKGEGGEELVRGERTSLRSVSLLRFERLEVEESRTSSSRTTPEGGRGPSDFRHKVVQNVGTKIEEVV